MRILVVEDEPRLGELVRRGLAEGGHAVDLADRGEDALWRARSTAYDVVVLDLALPDVDGVEVCRRMRADDVATPVLMLTARDAVADRIAGLDAGADDYLPKPFDFGELEARIRALGRRGPIGRPVVLRSGDLRLDPAAGRAWHGETEIELSATELRLLEAFMRRPGEVLDRVALLEAGWDHAYENRSNVVDVYIGYLRRKIDRPFGTDRLRTVRGLGYRLEDG